MRRVRTPEADGEDNIDLGSDREIGVSARQEGKESETVRRTDMRRKPSTAGLSVTVSSYVSSAERAGGLTPVRPAILNRVVDNEDREEEHDRLERVEEERERLLDDPRQDRDEGNDEKGDLDTRADGDAHLRKRVGENGQPRVKTRSHAVEAAVRQED